MKRSPQTLGQYLRSWLEHHRRYGGRDGKGLAPNTYQGYKDVLEGHVIPYLGDMPLQEVGPDHLKRLYAHMEQEKKLSRRMAALAHTILHKAFGDGVVEGKLAYNPCDRVPSPPRVRYRAEDRPWLAAERVPEVLAAAQDTRYYLPLFVAMSTGLRRNEVLGLTWEDVDLEAGVLRVRRQWGPLDQDCTQHGRAELKTESARREPPIPPPLADALAAHKVAQQAQYGEAWHPGMLVFDRGDGRPIAPSDFDGAWRAIRKKLGLPDGLRLHDLRGSYVTWLAEQGVDLKTASVLAGHSTIQVTAQFYRRVSPKLVREARDAIARILGRPPATP